MFTMMDKAVKLAIKSINQNSGVTLYGDYDCDGLSSLRCLMDCFDIIGFDNYTCVEYTSRTHSVDKRIIYTVMDTSSTLCIIADTGSSELAALHHIANVADIIVLDHHEGNIDLTSLPDNIAIVNPTMNDGYVHLSGACVTYEFCIEFMRQQAPSMVKLAEKYLTFYAFAALYADSIYSDNSYARQLYAKAQDCILPPCFSNLEYFNISKRFSLFSYAPPINACFRNGAFNILNSLYLSKELILGADRNRILQDMDAIRNYSRQVSDALCEKVKPIIIGEFALVDLSGYLNQTLPNKIIWDNKGLIASRIAGQYKKCCVCIVTRGHSYTLSVRDYYGRDIYTIFSAFFRVGGHKPAFGGELSFADITRLKDSLSMISSLLPEPTPRNVVNFANMNYGQIYDIAFENEFRHEKDLVIVKIPTDRFTFGWTPPSFSERIEQFCLQIGENKVYIPLLESCRNNQYQYVHFYKALRLKGELIECD